MFSAEILMKRYFITSIVIGCIVAGLWRVGATRTRQPIEVIVPLADYKFEMMTPAIPAKYPLKFTFINQGVITHEVVVEKVGLNGDPIDFGGEAANLGYIDPGETKNTILTLDEPGLYQLVCRIPGHYEGGMFQNFRVKSEWDLLYGQPTQKVRLVAGVFLFLMLNFIAFVLVYRPSRRVGFAQTA